MPRTELAEAIPGTAFAVLRLLFQIHQTGSERHAAAGEHDPYPLNVHPDIQELDMGRGGVGCTQRHLNGRPMSSDPVEGTSEYLNMGTLLIEIRQAERHTDAR